MSNFTSPAIQAMNLIRYIGDEVSKSGEPIYQLPGLKFAILGWRYCGKISSHESVVAVLTGHLLKDPDYILRYHAGELECAGQLLESRFANRLRQVPADSAELERAILSITS